MVTKALTARAIYGMDCVRCGDDILAPEFSECVSERQVRHLWHCSSCGYRAEQSAYVCSSVGAIQTAGEIRAA